VFGPQINPSNGVWEDSRGEVGLVFVGVSSASGVLSKPLEAKLL